MKRIYIAYGSNMNIRQMASHCPDSKVLGVSQIEGYALEFHGGGGALLRLICFSLLQSRLFQLRRWFCPTKILPVPVLLSRCSLWGLFGLVVIPLPLYFRGTRRRFDGSVMG